MPRGLLGLYWNARPQSLDECADLSYRTLLELRKVGFDSFYQRGRSRKDALRRPVDASFEGIRKLLARGVNRNEVNREVIPELGFSLSLWSGHADDESLGVAIHCGSYSRWVGNNVTVTLPSEGPYCLEQVRAKAEAVFDALVSLWNPEQALLSDANLRWDGRRIARDVPAIKRYG